jgi:hypothetical protein
MTIELLSVEGTSNKCFISASDENDVPPPVNGSPFPETKNMKLTNAEPVLSSITASWWGVR